MLNGVNRKKVIIVSPHPDDETVACGGIIQKYLKNQDEVIIIFITNGEKAYSQLYKIDSNPTPKELGLIRKEEAKKALIFLGLNEDQLIFLEYGDLNLKDNFDEIKIKIKILFNHYKPDIFYFPHKFDTHLDHKMSYQILLEAINELGTKSIIYHYIIHKQFERIFDYLLVFTRLLGYKIVKENISSYSINKKKALEIYLSQKEVLSKYIESSLEYEIFIVPV